MYSVGVKLRKVEEMVMLDSVIASGLQPDYKSNPVYFFQLENGEQYEFPVASISYIQLDARYGKQRFNAPTEENILFTVWFKTQDIRSPIKVSDVLYCGLGENSVYYILTISGEMFEIPLSSVAYLRFSGELQKRKEEENKKKPS